MNGTGKCRVDGPQSSPPERIPWSQVLPGQWCKVSEGNYRIKLVNGRALDPCTGYSYSKDDQALVTLVDIILTPSD